MGYRKKTTYIIKSRKNYSFKDNKVFFELENDINVVNYLSDRVDDNTLIIPYDKSILDNISNIQYGVYVFVIKNKDTDETDCAYVGCSQNVKIRLYCHEALRMLTNAIHECFEIIVYIFPCDKLNYKQLESLFILELNPFLNSQYNPHFNQKKIIYYTD